MALTLEQMNALEAERLDISYRVPAGRQRTVSVDHSEALLAIYYNAGRFAAGARDKQAIQADLDFQRLLSGRN